MKMKKPTLYSKIRDYIAANPDADNAAVAKALKLVDKNPLYQVRHALKVKSGSVLERVAPAFDNVQAEDVTPAAVGILQLDVTMPAAGMILKIKNGQGMIGTLVLTHDGLTFLASNAKKKPEKPLTWNMLKALVDAGLT